MESAYNTDMRERDRQFNQVMQEYGPMVGRVAASYEFNPALKEELAQEIALAVWRALPSFGGRSS